MSSDRGSNRYRHHWEHEDGSVITMFGALPEPNRFLVIAMAASHYVWIHSEVNS